jgi:poly(3-hydroxyalkanoate) synthetase
LIQINEQLLRLRDIKVMYKPAGQHNLSLAFLWPALAAASASDMAAVLARQFTHLAVGFDGPSAQEPQWATPHAITLELDSVRLRDFSPPAKELRPRGFSALLCTPLALHGAVIGDLVEGHSLVGALRGAGLTPLFVTDWRSATPDMRHRGIDDYLADLNILVDDIGAPIDLIGLCQGGFMALVYAARFPEKVRKLVLAAAPVDISAGTSALSSVAAASPLAMFHEIVRLGDGLVPGRRVLKLWAPDSVEAEDIRQLLQTEEPAGSAAAARLEAVFRDWYAWTLDLPGRFFLDAVEKLYKRNELATGSFVALGRKIDLAAVRTPLYLLAARDDELVAPAQLFAAEHLVGTTPHDLRKATAPCRHLGLFMGKRILQDVWPGVVRWLVEPTIANPQHVPVRVAAQTLS